MAIYKSRYTRTQLDEGIGASYVPTLNSAPTTSTLTYTRADLPSESQTVSFVVGQMCRVAVTGGYDFYQLKDVTSGVATWEKVADINTIPQGYCDTSSSTRDKVVTCTDYAATANSYIMILMKNANSYSTNNSTIRLNINGNGNKTVYINGVSSSSSSNKTLPAGSYLVFYDGTNYYFRTDGKITGNITGDAATVNGKTVGVNVPANAVFTDTTYSVMGASGSSHASGLTPDTPSTAGTTKYLREDGTWVVPPDTTYVFNTAYNASSNKAATMADIPSSLPASDVYSWAKASTKPTYKMSEVADISVVDIATNTTSVCTIRDSASHGKSQTIIYTNSTNSDLYVTVPTHYVTPEIMPTPSGNEIILLCPAGGYCEVNYLNVNGTIYSRGL